MHMPSGHHHSPDEHSEYLALKPSFTVNRPTMVVASTIDRNNSLSVYFNLPLEAL